MKKFWLILVVLVLVSCVKQTIKQEATFLENHTFEEVWNASIKAINDIKFTVDSMDKEAGFIAAERGRRAIFENAPPRLSVMIKEVGGKVYVDCKVLQKNQFIDIGGVGKKTVRKFMIALNQNLNR
ncbi:MAG: hypothetical protein E3J44_02555 [Candidatus Aminicenantes bacterium]|nr:MAG: hypothetical protein E3J44_02555 [Candidatus Aminicenantes bacterium]